MPSADPPPFAPNAVQFLRTIEQMQLQLSQMADQKASMLMGATFVVFTITVAQLRGGTAMLLPIVILAVSAFLSALFAILTVLPRITTTRHRVAPTDNILFFGIYAGLSEQAFADEVIAHMHDEETMYRMMLRDIHQAGLVMQKRKYRMLGYAYRTFLVGMVMTALAAGAELAVAYFG